MKEKKGMGALSLLMVLVLSVVVMVLIVSVVALTTPNGPGENEYMEKTSVVEESSMELPDFQPSIMDKWSYEEEKEYMKSLPPSPPLPESEIVHIIVSEEWLLQNDEDKRSEIIKFTIPASWLKESPVNESESIVLLRVPKKMLELDNTNTDPNKITVSYPIEMFKFHSNLGEMEEDQNEKKEIFNSMNIQLLTTVSGLSGSVDLNSDSVRSLRDTFFYFFSSEDNPADYTGFCPPSYVPAGYSPYVLNICTVRNESEPEDRRTTVCEILRYGLNITPHASWTPGTAFLEVSWTGYGFDPYENEKSEITGEEPEMVDVGGYEGRLHDNGDLRLLVWTTKNATYRVYGSLGSEELLKAGRSIEC